MSLRDQLIEAGARALAASINDIWDTSSRFQKNVFRKRATTALDAFLDTLEAEGWISIAIDTEDLIQAIRDTK